MSFFEDIVPPEPIAILEIYREYMEDPDPKKVSLISGAYRDDDGHPWVFPAVQAAEKLIATNKALNKEYLSALGLPEFTDLTTKLLLGSDSSAILENKVVSFQSLSGSGGIRIIIEFLIKILRLTDFYISNRTWDNYKNILPSGGVSKLKEYRYWSQTDQNLDLKGLLEDLEKAPKKSVFVFQLPPHNPTGCDPDKDQWLQISKIVKSNNLFVLFDSAYTGFATGDYEEDCYPVRIFVEQKIEFICVQSFAKNFGLYNERIGNVVLVMNNTKNKDHVHGHLEYIIRGIYSDPVQHGALIVCYILKDPVLYKLWQENLKTMYKRLKNVREMFYQNIKADKRWKFVKNQTGMFCYDGPNEKLTDYLKKNHIYLPYNGRIALNAINSHNIELVSKVFREFK